MKKKTLLLLLTTFLAALGAAGLLATLARGRAVAAPPSPQQATTYDDQRTAARAAAWWLVSAHQNDDGGYAPFSPGANQDPSTVGGTVDAMLALGAAGYPLGEPFPGKSQTPLDYLRSRPADVAAYAAAGGGEAGKLLQALVVANEDPYDFAGTNVVVSLTSHLSTTGQFAATPYQHALAMLGLAAVSEPVPLTATQWLTAEQNAAGAWSDGFGTDDNVDATAMSVMALVAGGVPTSATSLISATQFLAGAQLPGGWPYAPGFAESTNSTALAVQALSALGEDFYSDGSPWAQDGTPLAALLAWQREGGAFQVDFGGGAFDDFYATAQALPAVTGRPYPLPGRYESARQAIACLDDLQDPATGGWEQFAGFGVNAAGTSRAIQAIAAFGEDPDAPRWTMTDTTAVEALEDLTPAYLSDGRGGRVGIVMQGVVAAGDPYTVTSFAGYNLPISVTQYLSPTGEYADTSFGPVAHDEAMLGLLVAGYPVDPTAVQWLLDAHTGGDWGDPDADGLSLNVLARLGVAPPEAIDHLRQTQGADGGWMPSWAAETDPSSTSEVVQGLVSAGHNPFDPSWSQVVSGRISNAAHALMAQQMDGGCWPGFDGSTPDPFATTDAVLLMMAGPGWYAQVAHLPAVFD